MQNSAILSTSIKLSFTINVKPDVKRPLSKRLQLVFKTNYRLMQAKSIAEHSAILSTSIKLFFVINIFVLSSFEWPFYTGFAVVIERTCSAAGIIYNLKTNSYLTFRLK